MMPSGVASTRQAGPLDVVAILVVALVALVLFLDQPHVLSGPETRVDLAPAYLPVYAMLSLARMLAAYLISLVFALVAGYWAAFSPSARRFILPSLDVAQSVPILGFFPAAVFFFIRLFHGSAAGIEAAAIFLIFTSQAWNLAFSVYESLTTIPADISTAVQASGATGFVRWRRLLLPACVPSLVYNSMLSWSAGWYFLIASEIITVGPRSYTLPGLGSYVGEAIEQGRYGLSAAGISTLIAVIVVLHIAVWSPLEYWSRRFRYEFAATTPSPTPFALAFIHRAPLTHRFWTRLIAVAARGAGFVFGWVTMVLTATVMRYVMAAGALVALAALAYGAVSVAAEIARPLPPDARAIPAALVYSFLRLLVAYAISLAWTLPVAYWLSRSARRSARVLPVLQILAGVPATAFFPIIVVAVLRLHLSLNVAAVVLILTGMQWYLLFNVVAGAQAMPGDLRELATASGVRGLLYVKRFFLPVAAPSLITGSITGWGGGWNALIISEYVSAGTRTYEVPGIGTLLDRATYVQGDLQMITLTIMSMVVVIFVLNRLVWRRLYRVVSRRFTLEY